MNETAYDSWVDSWVTYHGTRRMDALGDGQRFKVVQDNEQAAAFDAGIFGLQWCAKSNLRRVAQPGSDLVDVDKIFSQASGGPREQIKHEIERLKTRLAELETALKVIDSL